MARDQEHQEQKALFEFAEWQQGKYPELKLMYAVPNGGHRHVAVAKKLKAEGVKSGVPDIELPVTRGGYTGLHVEMKVKPNKPSQAQRDFMAALGEQGRLCCVCYGAKEAWEAIKAYLEG